MIQEADPELFATLRFTIKTSQRSNNWSSFIQKIRFGYEPERIEYAIASDNSDLFGHFLARSSRPAFAILSDPVLSRWTNPCEHQRIRFRTVIQMIAFCGSIKCFRKLMGATGTYQYPDGVEFDDLLCQCALFGGVDEIVRWIERHDSAPIFDFPHCAAASHHVTLMEWVLSRSSAAAACAQILFDAAASNCVEAAMFAMSNGADVNAMHKGLAPIHVASIRDATDVFRILVDFPGVTIDRPSQVSGQTPLHYAACGGNHVIVELLAGRVDINRKMARTGQTALHVAVIHGWVTVVAVLLRHPRTDVNAQAVDLRTPLHDAAAQGNLQIARLLLADKRCRSKMTDFMGV
jgi:hypothetical protein